MEPGSLRSYGFRILSFKLSTTRFEFVDLGELLPA